MTLQQVVEQAGVVAAEADVVAAINCCQVKNSHSNTIALAMVKL